MEQAVATHAARLGEKLRAGGLGTDHVTVYFHTSEHDRDRPQRSVSSVVILPEASNDTLVLVKACLHGVRKTWRDGYRYKPRISARWSHRWSFPPTGVPGVGQLDREYGAALMGALDACIAGSGGAGRQAPVGGQREWSPQHIVMRAIPTKTTHKRSRRGAGDVEWRAEGQTSS